MNPEAQRIAIAEACGWKFQGAPPYSPNESIIPPKGALVAYKDLPDYLNDLNAMHEAEKAMGFDRMSLDPIVGRYHTTLCLTVGKTGEQSWCAAACAPAKDRAEAFLRTLNLWDDTK